MEYIKTMDYEKGLVIVYTGNGKGKTTAALGLAVRALGYGKKVLIVQFGKAKFSGEIKSLSKFKPSINIIQGGRGFVGILGDKLSFQEHKMKAYKTWEKLYQEVIFGKWDLVIVDEIIGALAGRLLTINQLLKLIKDKPDRLDLVLTGRHAPAALIKQADLVTEMTEIKHPFRKGILAKKGIDF